MAPSAEQYNVKEIISFLAWVVPVIILGIGISIESTSVIQLGGMVLIGRTVYYYFTELDG